MKFLSAGAIFLILFLVIIVFLSAVLPANVLSWLDLEGGFKKSVSPFSFGSNKEGFTTTTTYSTYLDNKPIDSGISNLIDPSKEKDCKKIKGFNGLFCNPTELNGGLDVFYGLPSNSTCEGSGLTKSNGNVCLDKASYNLLTTRGGNSTGSNSTQKA
jgi:hypothetical protein